VARLALRAAARLAVSLWTRLAPLFVIIGRDTALDRLMIVVAGHGKESVWAAAVCKTVGSAYVGSNPTPATTCENGPLVSREQDFLTAGSVSRTLRLWL
jgi:hypothetical protein